MTEWSTLFTDIVGSTKRLAAIGDAAWAELLEGHHAVVRAKIARFEGAEMDTAGDGVFAVFPESVAAVAAGLGSVDAVRDVGLTVRVGIHSGDCLVADGKCTGLAIHIAARIVALAAPGEVLVSDRVRANCGSAYCFNQRGVHKLRDVPGTWSLFAAQGNPEVTIMDPAMSGDSEVRGLRFHTARDPFGATIASDLSTL